MSKDITLVSISCHLLVQYINHLHENNKELMRLAHTVVQENNSNSKSRVLVATESICVDFGMQCSSIFLCRRNILMMVRPSKGIFSSFFFLIASWRSLQLLGLFHCCKYFFTAGQMVIVSRSCSKLIYALPYDLSPHCSRFIILCRGS